MQYEADVVNHKQRDVAAPEPAVVVQQPAKKGTQKGRRENETALRRGLGGEGGFGRRSHGGAAAGWGQAGARAGGSKATAWEAASASVSLPTWPAACCASASPWGTWWQTAAPGRGCTAGCTLRQAGRGGERAGLNGVHAGFRRLYTGHDEPGKAANAAAHAPYATPRRVQASCAALCCAALRCTALTRDGHLLAKQAAGRGAQVLAAGACEAGGGRPRRRARLEAQLVPF